MAFKGISTEPKLANNTTNVMTATRSRASGSRCIRPALASTSSADGPPTSTPSLGAGAARRSATNCSAACDIGSTSGTTEM